ncbi:MAG: AraC family ligand binding domain-containing protein [Gammaproteobacteria bacterium]|nr:AraC family ligand binding domain-containing protein [Gammaproteobacteria bacterium]
MKISLKHQGIERKNSEACIATEHHLNDKMIDFAIVKISGRYPSAQRAMNQLCKEIVYVSEGNGKVVVEGKEYLIHSGDVVLIEPGEKYYWEGDMNLFASCAPAWTKEQHLLVE